MKKVLSVLLTVILVLSIGAIGAQAASYDPDRTYWCYLEKNEAYEETPKVLGRDKFYGGRNYADSGYREKIGVMYYSTSGKKYVYDTYKIIDIGQPLYSTHCKTTFTEEVYWKTRVEPYGETSGCHGAGFIWYI